MHSSFYAPPPPPSPPFPPLGDRDFDLIGCSLLRSYFGEYGVSKAFSQFLELLGTKV
jgi:hypothetical protein